MLQKKIVAFLFYCCQSFGYTFTNMDDGKQYCFSCYSFDDRMLIIRVKLTTMLLKE